MTQPNDDAIDPRKVRAGLAIVTAIVLVAVVLAVVIDSPVGRSLMVAVAAVGVLRTVLLARSLRRS